MIVIQNCELCGREGPPYYFEKHHLEPKNNKSDTIIVCHQCGDQIHLFFDNNTLTTELNTKEALLENEKMLNYIQWVKNKPLDRSFTTAEKKRRK